MRRIYHFEIRAFCEPAATGRKISERTWSGFKTYLGAEHLNWGFCSFATELLWFLSGLAA